METRVLVERFALEKVIKSGVDLSEELNEILRRHDELATQGRPAEFAEVDRELHSAIVAAAETIRRSTGARLEGRGW